MLNVLSAFIFAGTLVCMAAAGVPAPAIMMMIVVAIFVGVAMNGALNIFDTVERGLSKPTTHNHVHFDTYEQYITNIHPKQTVHEGTETVLELPDGTVQTTRHVVRWN